MLTVLAEAGVGMDRPVVRGLVIRRAVVSRPVVSFRGHGSSGQWSVESSSEHRVYYCNLAKRSALRRTAELAQLPGRAGLDLPW